MVFQNDTAWEFRISTDPTPPDAGQFGVGLLENFALYARHASAETELFWVTARAGGMVAALIPVVKLRRRKTTDMLRKPLRRWLGPVLGPLARKTSLLLDTSFLAYDDCSPFYSLDAVDRSALKRAASAFLKAQRGVDSIWIAEPPAEAEWASSEGFAQFQTLPMVHVELDGCRTIADYVGGLSKKRRRNLRHDRETFAAAGATVEIHQGPLVGRQELLDRLLACLRASESHGQFTVPYNDVLTDPNAFAEQPQTVLAAKVDGQVVGFMSFLQDGDRLLQCHGGLDYERSHDVLAYHNLIYAGIEHAIGLGSRLLSMGPLNNETKRRAGTTLRPMIASLWNRNPVDNLVARKVFIKNFEVYRGEVGEELELRERPPTAG